MVAIGDRAPDFTLVADDGSQVSLSDYLGQKVVIYFFPKADTPGCTTQACAVRDVYPQVGAGVVVIGISPDQPEALIKFRRKYDLPFVLLSDPDHAVIDGTKEVWRSIFAATFTTVAIFLPFLFASNFFVKLIGKQIGVSIISTLLVSLVVALLLIPAFTHRLLTGRRSMRATTA